MVTLQESVARLRECGVAGDDAALVALLEAAGFDVNRAANLFLDGRVVHSSAASLLAEEVEYSPRPLAGEAAAVVGGRAKREKRKKAQGDAPVQEREATHRRSYADRSQKAGHKPSPCVTIIRSGAQERPTGVHYEPALGESYDVDVLRMQQTHSESGSMRKIRREKKGVWRFDKKGSTWGIYPGYVAVELERIFLSLDRQRGSLALEMAQETVPEDAPEAPRRLTDPIGFSHDSLDGVSRRLGTELSGEAVEAAGELLLAAAEAGGLPEAVRAAALLEALAVRHGLRCDVGHIRRAGLVIGSMRLLQAALSSAPDLSLVGLDLFDRKYAKANMQDLGRKNCVRCLLARGMQLGSSNCAPQGKLLRKVEADAEPAWAQRCLDSMMLECPQLPDSVRDRVCAWLGVDLPPYVQSQVV